MGPRTLFDKSFLQSLTSNEAVFFDQFFATVRLTVSAIRSEFCMGWSSEAGFGQIGRVLFGVTSRRARQGSASLCFNSTEFSAGIERKSPPKISAHPNFSVGMKRKPSPGFLPPQNFPGWMKLSRRQPAPPPGQPSGTGGHWPGAGRAAGLRTSRGDCCSFSPEAGCPRPGCQAHAIP